MVRVRLTELSIVRWVALFLTITAAVLVAMSLTLPWYEVGRTGELTPSPDLYHGAVTYVIYSNHVEWKSPLGYSHPYVYGDHDPAQYVMDIEVLMILIWVVMAALFIGTLLFTDVLGNLLSGLALSLVAVGTVLYFVSAIGEHATRLLYNTVEIRGFIGHDSIWSWGPLDGWYIVAAALAIQIPAVVLGIIAIHRET